MVSTSLLSAQPPAVLQTPVLQAPASTTAPAATTAVSTPLLPLNNPAPSLVATPAKDAASCPGCQTMIYQIVAMVCMMIQNMIAPGSATNFNLPGAAPASATSAASAPKAASGAATVGANTAKPNNGRLVIAQVDLFTGSTHGNEIAQTLKSGGGDPSLASRIDLLQFDIGGGGSSQKTNDALKAIIQKVQNGEKIDAVNLSLTSFVNDASSQETRALVDQLGNLGVPVAIAAGNNGPNQENQLEGSTSFNVQSATNGKLNASSGRGNVTAEGRTTSFATANLAPILAAKRADGQTLSQIRASL